MGAEARDGNAVKRIAVRALAALVLVVGLATARSLVSGRAELARANAALRADDIDLAIVLYRRAASWYVPLAPHVSRALEALEAISHAAEARGDVPRSLAAERAIRAAIMATRSTYVPHATELARADARIGVSTRDARATAQSATARPPDDPHLGGTLLALLGWLGWMGAALVTVTRGIDAEGRLTKVAARAGVGFAFGFVAFALGLAVS